MNVPEGNRITEPYAHMVARDLYFWAWPMVNVYNRRLAFSHVPSPGIMNDLPFAPLNRLAMLADYVEAAERWVACPNQDVVYGAGILALDQSPAVVQVPDFGKPIANALKDDRDRSLKAVLFQENDPPAAPANLFQRRCTFSNPLAHLSLKGVAYPTSWKETPPCAPHPHRITPRTA
jgi:hypothetical protein